ncbi:hypothetical protein BJ322DRAFT_1111574 [Thelephora terrestris]|uniref:BTB domain-containing protein n=1 Tax=Thelephora terrestris TaxID=56493 RepID=A0A9P6L494_9AGAM|nr:hypothetical protein BJ322DRAFT_1111574 [Thelephora terrestris]
MPSKEHNTVETTSTASVPVSTEFCADDADVIIRATGTLDFRVHKAILSLVSPFFKDMLTLPQPPSAAPETPPHVDVQDLDDLQSLLLAAKKYDMHFVIHSHKKSFQNRAFIQQDPLHLYAIACACEIDDQAKYVARNADLLTVVKTAKNDGLDIISSASYHRLIAFLFARDNELHPILERNWALLTDWCECRPANFNRKDLYECAKKQLKTPYIWMEEVYLVALEGRSQYYRSACTDDDCSVAATKIKEFLERMFQERERVCDKFMWE